MSKQVSPPKISSILQKMKIGQNSIYALFALSPSFVADTKYSWTKSETFFVSRTQNLCLQLMLCVRANEKTFVSETMCSCLPGPLYSNCYFILNNIDKKDILCRLICITSQKLFALFWVKHFSDSICVAVSLLHEHNLLCDKPKEHILTPSLDKGMNRSFLSVLPRATFLIFNGTNMVACNFVHFAANGIKGLLVATGNGASFPWQQHKLNVGHQIFIVPYSTDI